MTPDGLMAEGLEPYSSSASARDTVSGCYNESGPRLRARVTHNRLGGYLQRHVYRLIEVKKSGMLAKRDGVSRDNGKRVRARPRGARRWYAAKSARDAVDGGFMRLLGKGLLVKSALKARVRLLQEVHTQSRT